MSLPPLAPLHSAPLGRWQLRRPLPLPHTIPRVGPQAWDRALAGEPTKRLVWYFHFNAVESFANKNTWLCNTVRNNCRISDLAPSVPSRARSFQEKTNPSAAANPGRLRTRPKGSPNPATRGMLSINLSTSQIPMPRPLPPHPGLGSPYRTV